MAVETSAGNTKEDINFEVKERGNVCLTCGARAQSVVMTEMSRTQHGRSVVVNRTGGSEVVARESVVVRGAAVADACQGLPRNAGGDP